MTDPLDAQALELIGLAEKATEGPWVIAAGGPPREPSIISPAGDAELGNWMVAPNVRWPENAAFIAHARNHAPAIARAYLEARAEIERLRTTMGALRKQFGMIAIMTTTRTLKSDGVKVSPLDAIYTESNAAQDYIDAALHPQPDTTKEK